GWWSETQLRGGRDHGGTGHVQSGLVGLPGPDVVDVPAAVSVEAVESPGDCGAVPHPGLEAAQPAVEVVPAVGSVHDGADVERRRTVERAGEVRDLVLHA